MQRKSQLRKIHSGTNGNWSHLRDFLIWILNSESPGTTCVWSSYSDPHTPLIRSEFALGYSKRDTKMLDWNDVENYEDLIYPFEIPNGTPAWIRARFTNIGKTDDSTFLLYLWKSFIYLATVCWLLVMATHI